MEKNYFISKFYFDYNSKIYNSPEIYEIDIFFTFKTSTLNYVFLFLVVVALLYFFSTFLSVLLPSYLFVSSLIRQLLRFYEQFALAESKYKSKTFVYRVTLREPMLLPHVFSLW